MTKISLVICNYNYENYISEAIISVLNQSYPAHEIIVVDDGSTDNSIEIIKSFEPKLKLIRKSNGGQISAYNEGIKHVTGDVVLFLDADDVLLSNALNEINKKFDHNIVKVQFKMNLMYKEGTKLNKILPSTLDSGDCSHGLINYGILYKSPPASGNAYRVEALAKIFPIPIPPNNKHGADYFCIYVSALLGNIATIDLPLFNYRIHKSPEDDTSDSLSYGNAIHKYNIQDRAMTTWNTFKSWVENLSKNQIVLPDRFLDFTQQKLFFAVDVMNSVTMNDKFSIGRKHFVWLFRAIKARKDFNLIKKSALVIWFFLVLISPRNLSLYLAKKVCNPK